jgi:hypothetical protein
MNRGRTLILIDDAPRHRFILLLQPVSKTNAKEEKTFFPAPEVESIYLSDELSESRSQSHDTAAVNSREWRAIYLLFHLIRIVAP